MQISESEFITLVETWKTRIGTWKKTPPFDLPLYRNPYRDLENTHAYRYKYRQVKLYRFDLNPKSSLKPPFQLSIRSL